MRLKLYRAPSMAEAMTRVRSELGPDALILGARTLRDGVEITAAIEPAPDAVPSAAPPRPHAWRPAPLVRPGARAAIVAHHAIPPSLAERMEGASLAGGLAQALRFAPIAADAGPLLMVGPPGAGKTSTVARLATRLVLSGQRPLVITADGRRAGATEQLAAYTRLLGLSLVVASHPVALARALSRREAGAAVLIDAPGGDAHDPVQMQELAGLARAVEARLALVLPAGLDAREGADIARAYADIGASLLVANRLDLVRRLGSLLDAADAGRFALAEAGIGAGAADGLVPLTAALLAERLQRCVSETQPSTPHKALA